MDTGWPSLTSNGQVDLAEKPITAELVPATPPTPAKAKVRAIPAKPMARLRLNTVGDTAKELRKLYREARAGTIATGEATKLAYLLTTLAGLMVTSDLEARVDAIEHKGSR
jgi:hypothetical protein